MVVNAGDDPGAGVGEGAEAKGVRQNADVLQKLAREVALIKEKHGRVSAINVALA